MKKPIVSLAFAKLADAQLVTKTNQILASMTGNTNYPTPTPTLAVVQAAATAFSTALTAAADGGRTKTAEKNAARTILLGLLRNLALYVQQTSDENLVVLLSSGFDAQKEPQPAGILPAPQAVTLTQSPLSGQLDFRAKPVANASAYEAQMTTDINKDEWENVGTFTAIRFALEDLKTGTLYWARSRAVGAAGAMRCRPSRSDPRIDADFTGKHGGRFAFGEGNRPSPGKIRGMRGW